MQGSTVSRMNVEEEEEQPWEEVKGKRRRGVLMKPPRYITTGPYSSIQVNKKKKKKKERRQWDALPSLALINIFCNTELKDRLQSIPLVCKSWKTVTDDDPRCWSSMIPNSVSPEDAFIRNTSGYKFESYEVKLSPSNDLEDMNLYQSYTSKLEKRRDFDLLIGISRLFKEEEDHEVEFEEDISRLFKEEEDPEEVEFEEYIEEEEEEEEIEEVPVAFKRLRTLIKKSGGGAAITTLYLSPITPHLYWHSNIDETFDKMLHLIANCCPNLKHISFEAYHNEEALFQIFNKCKKLELVDLPYADGPLVIQMGKCLPNLRGIRIRDSSGFTTSSIATYLPQLKLLSLGFPTDLSVTLFSCLELQYLYVEYDESDRLDYPQDIVDQASAQIPEFYFQLYHDISPWHESYDCCYDCDCLGGPESMEQMLERKKETDIDNTYLYIRKQRKEDQYVSILKNDQNVSILKKKIKYYHILKRKERDQCNSRLKKKKKKCQYDSTLRKKKKDQCDYADYVIR